MHRVVDGGFNGWTEPHVTLVVEIERGWLAADDQHSWWTSTKRLDQTKNGRRVHAVRVYGRPGGIDRGFQQVQRARLPTTRRGVHQHGGTGRVHQRVRQVETADAEVDHLNAIRKRPPGEATHDFDSECVVAEKDVADTRHQDAHRTGSTSSG